MVAPSYELIEPVGALVPIVVASPHSGQIYPDDLIAASRLCPRTLRTSEDCFVNELFGAAPGLGAPLLHALYARAYLDLNREPYELDPAMYQDRLPDFVNTASARVGVGLGTIARVVAEGQPIYHRKLQFAEAVDRIERLYRPYHDILEMLIRRTTSHFGYAILVDAHSMPSGTASSNRTAANRATGERRVDIVLGDRLGSSCHPVIIGTAEAVLRGQGYRVVRNVPYAGGFTTRRYGVPDEGRHCLQIEVNRSLYMDEASLQKRPGFKEITENIGKVLAALRNIPSAQLFGHSAEAAQ